MEHDPDRVREPAASDAAAQNAASSNVRGARSRAVMIGALLGVVMAIVVVLGAIVLSAPRSVPILTKAAYEEAVRSWETNGPKSYKMDLKLTGARPGQIHVEVQNGEVTEMTRDGVEPRQHRTWDYWSVPGQLNTIGEEMEMAANPEGAFGASTGKRVQVVQQADFDPRYGYPRTYHRQVLGTSLEIHWQVTHFEPLP